MNSLKVDISGFPPGSKTTTADEMPKRMVSRSFSSCDDSIDSGQEQQQQLLAVAMFLLVGSFVCSSLRSEQGIICSAMPMYLITPRIGVRAMPPLPASFVSGGAMHPISINFEGWERDEEQLFIIRQRVQSATPPESVQWTDDQLA